jgi:hypothetical protein
MGRDFMKKTIVWFLASVMVLCPVLAFASATESNNNLQKNEIQALNSLPGSKNLLQSSGSGCIRWEQHCKPNTFFPEREDCTSECVEQSSDSSGSSYSSSSSGGGGGVSFSVPGFDEPVRLIAWIVVIAGMIWLFAWVLTPPKSSDAAPQ